MKQRTLLLLIFLVGSAFALSACELSMAADITPPPGVQSAPHGDLSESTGPDLIVGAFPAAAPDIENGAAIYTEKCAPCHGDTGLGDGPDAAQLSVPVAALGTANFAETSSPLEWYSMVTSGNIQNFMPPFSSLTDQERWDVVTYAYSLYGETLDEFISIGATAYAEKCVECHGEDGNAGTEGAALLGSQELMVQFSNMDIAGAIMLGTPDGMPAFGDDVEDEELAGLVYYARSLTIPIYGDLVLTDAADITEPEDEATEAVDVEDPDDTPEGEAEDTEEVEDTPEETEAAEIPDVLTMTVKGQVVNVTGGEVPAGLEVTLLGLDHLEGSVEEAINIIGSTDERGDYVFEDVEMVEQRLYVVLVDYDNQSYYSEPFAADLAVELYEMTVEVYDSTTNTEHLTVDHLRVIFDFQKPDVARVFLVYEVSNNGTETVVSAIQGDPVTRYTLAEGGSNISFQDEETANNAVEIEGGFGDLRPIFPGASSYQIVFSFELAYGKELEFTQPLNLPVDAVMVYMPDGKIELNSEQVAGAGIEDIGGSVYQVYEGGAIVANGSLELTLKGKHPVAGTAGSEFSLGDQPELIFGGVALALSVAVAALWLVGARNKDTVADWEETPEGVMDAILDLDEAYEDGEMDEKVYQARREELKDLLQELLDEE